MYIKVNLVCDFYFKHLVFSIRSILNNSLIVLFIKIFKQIFIKLSTLLVTNSLNFCVSENICFPGGSEVKASASKAGDRGSIPGSGRFPGEGNGNPLQYSCLENPMDGGAWQATVHWVAKSWTQLSNLTHFYIGTYIQ